MNKIREYILLRLAEIARAEIDEDAIRQGAVDQATQDAVADLEANGLTDADKAYVDSILSA